MSTVRHLLCKRTCESWAGAVMVPEGKDNIKGQAWLGWYTEQLALSTYTGDFQPHTRGLSLACHAWGLRTPTRVGAMQCAGGGGKVKPACRNNAMRDVTMACIDTSATDCRSSSTTVSPLFIVLIV
jgi:hypothetical protein